MTCIVDRFKTKKALKEAVERGEHFWIFDPSIVAPRSFSSIQLKEGEEIVATNHPKRSWFAQIGRKAGKLYVK